MRRLAASALLVAGLLAAPPRGRAADPAWRWFTIETPHFRVHFYRSPRHDLAPLARRAARLAERAHAALAPAMGHTPAAPTHIVLTDDTDSANGSAQVVPYNAIRLLASAPSSMSALNDHDDWLYTLIVHEYAHILHLDTIHGVPRWVNRIFGKVWAPNQVQPRWFVEGLATYLESARTSGGRVRSALFDMFLRAAVLAGQPLRLDQVSGLTRIFPRGHVPYLYGGRFLDFIARRYGEPRLFAIGHAYGGGSSASLYGAMPYALNRTARAVLGRDYEQLYADFLAHLRRRYAAQRRAAEARGLTGSVPVTRHGESAASPRVSADGRLLAFKEGDGHSRAQVTVLRRGSGARVAGFEDLGGAGLALTPDGRALVTPRASFTRTFLAYHDLFLVDLASGAARQLTRGARADAPDVSPDGRTLVFVVNEAGRRHLATMPLRPGAPIRRVYTSGPGEQVYGPRFSPDGRRVVFSRWRPGGLRDIALLRLDGGRVRPLTRDRAIDADPVFSPDGRRIYFASDRSGIYNIYCFDLGGGPLLQVTNVLGGAFAPAVTPDERTLYFVSYGPRGWDIHRMPLRRRAFLRARPHRDRRPPPTAPVAPAPPPPDRPYSPLGTLLPRSWTLRLGADRDGTVLGIQSRGGDVVGHHAYELLADVSTATGAVSYGASYAYDRFWPRLQLFTSRRQGRRGTLELDGRRRPYQETAYAGGLSLGLPLIRLPRHTVTLSAGYALTWLRPDDRPRVRVLPGDLAPRLPRAGLLAGVTLSLAYASVRRHPYSISDADGRRLFVGLRVDHPALGSFLQTTEVTWSYREYIPLPWSRDHVLALGYAGGLAAGDRSRRGIFSIGGYPDQDAVLALVNLRPIGGLFLRGYPPGSLAGRQYHIASAEYRLPVWRVERGLSTLPLYLRELTGAAFVDVGDAFDGDLDPAALKVGVGAALGVGLVVGHVVPLALRLTYAHGLMDPGGPQLTVRLATGF